MGVILQVSHHGGNTTSIYTSIYLTVGTFPTGLISRHNRILSAVKTNPAAEALTKRSKILIPDHWIEELAAG